MPNINQLQKAIRDYNLSDHETVIHIPIPKYRAVEDIISDADEYVDKEKIKKATSKHIQELKDFVEANNRHE